ncbi:Cysteine-rich PDZ-binding protein, partial [Linum grandiflorum]
EKKLAKVIVPDNWKEGASNTNESGDRKINENKLLSKKNRFVLLVTYMLMWFHRWTAYGVTKCMICKQQVHQDGKYRSTATPVPIPKESARCAVNKSSPRRHTSKATYEMTATGRC